MHSPFRNGARQVAESALHNQALSASRSHKLSAIRATKRWVLRQFSDLTFTLARISCGWASCSYSAWRSEILSGDEAIIPFALTHGTGRNLVLGTAIGYTAAHLRPFVRSLRAVSQCHALLIVDSEDLARYLESEHINSVLLPPPSTKFTPHVNFSRSALYIRLMEQIRTEIDWVFLTDTRDVVFQSDPFQGLETKPDVSVAFVEQGRDNLFSTDTTNNLWLREIMGAQYLHKLFQQRVLCGGTIFARPSAAIALCRQKIILGSLVSTNRHRRPGVDQITTNIVARFDLIPGSIVLPYNNPQVCNLSRNTSYLSMMEDGAMASEDGIIPAAVHQYDRVPALKEAVLNAYG